jgi:hypothetical protein
VTGFEGDPKMLPGIGFDPFEQLDVHVGDTSRCLDESLSGGIFSNGFKEFAHEALDARLVDHD